ncbi:MAG: hypothetical protein PF450_11870 [Bacteroidales bacterium]|nr:hypothetical protein [Bacteroidales bacterium]
MKILKHKPYTEKGEKMNSTIVKSVGFGEKKSGDQELISGIAGIEMVRLQHWMQFHEFSCSMKGFQGGSFQILLRAGSKKYTFMPQKDRFGDDVATPAPLVFEPDEVTGQLLAVIPVTKYNKDFLAKIYNHSIAPKILNSKLDEEIRELAKKYAEATVVEKDQSEMIADQASELEKVRRSLARKESELRSVGKRQSILERATNETVAKAEAKVVEELREQAKAEVCEEKDGLVGSLMETYGDDWEQSDEYKEGIAPEIQERLEVKLKEKGISKDEND